LSRLKERTLKRLEEVRLHRARLVTQSYRRTEGEPAVLRRAKALARFFRQAPLEIFDEEQLVGDRIWFQPYHFNYPDVNPKAQPHSDDPEIDAQLTSIWRYWRQEQVVSPTLTTIIGHCVPGFRKMLELGFDGMAAEAEASWAAADRHDPAYAAKRDFWEAAILLAKACGAVGRRYAALARKMAAATTGPRQAELLEIAQVCQRVPAKPARTFREAIQSLWLGELFTESEDPPNAHSPGRVDQLLWPYYERDLAEGRLTRAEAKELLACLWLKLYAPYDVHDTVIGGLKPDGTDATNELSYLILEVQAELGLYRQLSVRYHPGMPADFVQQACDVVRQGLGVPQWFNDDVIVPAVIDMGIPPEEARDYALIGCIETTIPGRADPRAVEHWSNLPKCLEYALTNGYCLTCGEQNGPQTGPWSEIQSYEDLWSRYGRQVELEVEAAVRRIAEAEARQVETYPMILLSLLTDDCVQRGIDMTAGGARYNSSMFCAAGIPNVADSLAALKKLVFEEGRVTLGEVVQAMKDNFEGHEALRQMLRHGAPKYGQDDDYVDAIARAVGTHYCETLAKFRNPRGGPLWGSFFTFTLCMSFGAMVGASPDGRLAGTPIANSLCAAQGILSQGPGALVKSASKLNQRQTPAGTSMLLDLHPSLLTPSHGHDPLRSLLETYFALGGAHAEFTLVSADRLREAQAHPDQYPHLTVRVAGYSARFVDLSREAQEHVIARTATMAA